MIGRLNHVAIAVPDLAVATTALSRHARRGRFRAVGATQEHGVWYRCSSSNFAEHQDRIAGPLGTELASLANSLEKNAASRWRSSSFATRSTASFAARQVVAAAGGRVLGAGEPKLGAHGKPVLLLHPKEFLPGRSSSSSRREAVRQRKGGQWGKRGIGCRRSLYVHSPFSRLCDRHVSLSGGPFCSRCSPSACDRNTRMPSAFQGRTRAHRLHFPRLLRKALWTTLISAVIFPFFYALMFYAL